MKQDRVLLAVDLSYQTYRAAAAHQKLTSGGRFTGGLYGFLMSLARQINITRATHVVLCQDLKPYLRSETYPQYKQLRKKEAGNDLLELFKESLPMILEAADVIGLPIMGFRGFESDDCIGWVAKTLRHRFTKVYASSNDSDLYQLLEYETFRLLKGGEMTEVVDSAVLMAKHDLTPSQFMLAQALRGTHNDVEGIPGVGEVTANKAVKDPAAMRKLRERWAEVIDRNQALQKLPHPEFPHTQLPEMGRFKARALYRFCDQYNIQVTGHMVSAFEQACP